MLQRSDAVRIMNRCVASVATADPVNWSETSPICGSSEKLMETIACGLTKCIRIKVMSLSPSTVVDSDALALGRARHPEAAGPPDESVHDPRRPPAAGGPHDAALCLGLVQLLPLLFIDTDVADIAVVRSVVGHARLA